MTAVQRLCLPLLLLALVLAGGSAALVEEPDGEEGIRILEADEPRFADRVRIGASAVRYRPVGLQWDKGYEVRVSFPGTNPVRLKLWLEVSGSSRGSSGSGTARLRRQLWLPGTHRKLLDAEKIMFRTDTEGRIWLDGRQLSSSVDIMLSAERWGVWWKPEHAPKVLTYDIVLEQSTLGVPHSALPLLGTGIMLVVLVVAALPWWTGKAVPAILRWLGSSSSRAPAAAAAARHATAAAAAVLKSSLRRSTR